MRRRFDSLANARLTASLVFLFLLSSTSGYADVLFVNATAYPGGDGSSWASALSDVSVALGIARSDSTINEIWIARGTYSTNDGEALELVGGVNLIGGFRGTETKSSEADSAAYPTILSGRDYTGEEHAIGVATSSSGTIGLTGLTFQNGDGGDAGAIHVENAKVTISNCVFEENHAVPLVIDVATVEISHSTFRDNSNAYGGEASAIVIGGVAAVVDISSSTFTRNLGGPTIRIRPGIIYLSRNGPIRIDNVTFEANMAFGAGIIEIRDWDGVAIDRGRFMGNTTDGPRAAIVKSIDSDVLITNTLIVDNHATAFYGTGQGRLGLTNATIYNNGSRRLNSQSSGVWLANGYSGEIANSVIALNQRRVVELIFLPDDGEECCTRYSFSWEQDEQSNVFNDSASSSTMTMHTSSVPQWSGLQPAVTWDILHGDPSLQQFGGGLQPKYAPKEDSPLVDAGDSEAYLRAGSTAGLDAYGHSRFSGKSKDKAIDIGAVERQY